MRRLIDNIEECETRSAWSIPMYCYEYRLFSDELFDRHARNTLDI